MDLSSLRKVVEDLEAGLSVVSDEAWSSSQRLLVQNTLRAGVIKQFCLAYDVCGKMIQRWAKLEFANNFLQGQPMLTVTSKEVQNHYGEFLEKVQDDVTCVTRYGRSLYWTISDRQIRDDPKVLIGKLLLLNGQLRQQSGTASQEGFGQFLAREVDPVLKTSGMTQKDINQIVHDARR
jgi:hypothetical protein